MAESVPESIPAAGMIVSPSGKSRAPYQRLSSALSADFPPPKVQDVQDVQDGATGCLLKKTSSEHYPGRGRRSR